MSKLLQSYEMNGTLLANRVLMAPMTRSRARDTVPDASTALYYRQRAGAGLIVTEGSQISVEGTGYLFTPGIHTPEQVKGWQAVTKGVHEEGGKIFIQIWHVGRISHISLQENGAVPVSSVAVPAKGYTCYAYDESGQPGAVPVSTPRAMNKEDIARVISDFVTAARNSMEAGFDGIEIHAANGYIFEQFISASCNTRTDEYGGSTLNRLRFVLDAVDAMSEAIGSSRVGIRLAPYGRLHDMHSFDDEENTWLTLAEKLSDRELAYVHLSDQESLCNIDPTVAAIPKDFIRKFRNAYKGTLVMTGSLTQETAEELVNSGVADLVGFGRPFISNPDLVERFRNGWPLTPFDHAVFYGGGDEGYIDYPTYLESVDNEIKAD
ncbi:MULTISPECIES: alkene reductase [Burkholderia]|uniref:alkene reductase n=1 Tax=Burkholderia TaxID=32008 RepID=UPI00064F196B|nr:MULTISPECIES: alkene reductase [Burkholderia]KML19746.1 NADH:flavin oxidoreductase [Burkholderia cepacia]KMN59587.1 NADH:flavin oxidoreductase [Burkholderia sp. LK4]